MNTNIEEGKVAELERRVLALEAYAVSAMYQGFGVMQLEAELTARYGDYVDKTVAARILGVTRTTVYAMLADGRIKAACEGRRVSVRSIAQYLQKPKIGEGGRSRRGKRSLQQPAMQA